MIEADIIIHNHPCVSITTHAYDHACDVSSKHLLSVSYIRDNWLALHQELKRV